MKVFTSHLTPNRSFRRHYS